MGADKLLKELESEELRHEGSGVQVAALCPGPVRTEFNAVAGVQFAIGGISSEMAAKCGIDGLLTGKGVIVPGAGMQLALAARHLVPESVLTRIAYHIQKRKG